MLLVSTTRIIPGRAVPSFLSGRYSAVKVRKKLYVTPPDGKSALMLVTARLKYVAESEWGSRRYLDVTLLEE